MSQTGLQPVAPEVWEVARAAATQASSREARPIRRVALGLALAVLLLWMVVASGVVSSHLEYTGSGGASVDGRAVTLELQVRNAGLVSAGLVGVTSNLSGLVVSSASLAPARLGARERGVLMVHLRIEDCTALLAAASRADSPSVGQPGQLEAQVPLLTVTTSQLIGEHARALSPEGLMDADLLRAACGAE